MSLFYCKAVVLAIPQAFWDMSSMKIMCGRGKSLTTQRWCPSFFISKCRCQGCLKHSKFRKLWKGRQHWACLLDQMWPRRALRTSIVPLMGEHPLSVGSPAAGSASPCTPWLGTEGHFIACTRIRIAADPRPALTHQVCLLPCSLNSFKWASPDPQAPTLMVKAAFSGLPSHPKANAFCSPPLPASWAGSLVSCARFRREYLIVAMSLREQSVL